MRLVALLNPAGAADAGSAADAGHWRELARAAERGRFDAVWVGDRLAADPAAERPAGGLEPLTLLAALAGATSRIGLLASASTTFHEPFHLARMIASLDHISHGRIGWHVAVSGSAAEAGNFGTDEEIERSVRYERAAEFLDVATQLWDSWADDAAPPGSVPDPARIREVDHLGLFFKVRGPSTVRRPPQGWPVLAVSAGGSAESTEFAARYAEIAFTASTSASRAAAFSRTVKDRAASYGRGLTLPLVLATVRPVVGATEQEARRLVAALEQRHAGRPGGGTRLLAGTPEGVADTLEAWFRAGAADGFTIAPSGLPGSLEDFVEQVVPVLQGRGLVRREYHDMVLRDRLGLERPQDHFPDAPERAPFSLDLGALDLGAPAPEVAARDFRALKAS